MNTDPQIDSQEDLERIIDEGAQNRRDIRELNHNHDFRGLFPGMIAYLKGRPLLVNPDSDRRRLQAMPTEGQVLKGLFRMFAVNEHNQFQNHRNKFDEASIRETSWMEIERLGTGRKYGGQFTTKQVRNSLKLLSDAGFITRWKEFNPTLKKSKLFIRLNARKIIATVEMLKVMLDTKTNPPPAPGGAARKGKPV